MYVPLLFLRSLLVSFPQFCSLVDGRAVSSPAACKAARVYGSAGRDNQITRYSTLSSKLPCT